MERCWVASEVKKPGRLQIANWQLRIENWQVEDVTLQFAMVNLQFAILTGLHAGGDHRPDTLAPLSADFAAGALGHATVDDHEANRLFSQIVGRFDSGRGDKLEVGFVDVQPGPA